MDLKRLLFLTLIVYNLSQPLEAQTPNISQNIEVKEDLINQFEVKNLEISEVAKSLAKLTGKGLIISPKVRGKITIILRHPVTTKELWDIFSVAIAAQGYTVRFNKKLNLVEILPINQAKTLNELKTSGVSGEYATSVISLKYANANKLYTVLRALLSPYGKIQVVSQSNTLVITDFFKNLHIIENIVKIVDNPNLKAVVKVYKLHYISSSSFIKSVSPLINYARETLRAPINYTELKDSNSVIILAPKEIQQQIELLYKKLDQPSEEFKRNFYVIKLKFVSVDEIQKALTSLLRQIKNIGNSLNFPGGLKISFDKTNNAVLIYGTKEEYQTLKRFISLLDKRKKQVLITATIVEASAKKILDKGIKWQILGSTGGVAFGAMSEQDLYNALTSGNFVIGTLSKTGVNVNIGGSTIFFPDLLFLYSLLEQGTGFHVISNPKILTLDNQKAVIKVGQDVPFPTGIKYDVNGNPIITYDYKYVGLDLDVTPRIAEKNLRLIIKLKVQEVTGYLNNNVGGINYTVPITSSRELNSDVVVQSGQTVIIGGLISRKSLNSATKVPFFGDIPVVGGLFKSEHKENDKTNLFIFITPYVISTPQELAKIMEEHKKLAQKLLALERREKKDNTSKDIKVEPNNDEEVVLPYH